MTTVVVSLGANLGDRLAALQAAVDGLGACRVSSVYETPPWGDPDQPWYLNAVVLAEHPEWEPVDWLRLGQRLEAAAGRVRDPARRYGPRQLDVDLITVTRDGTAVVSDDPDLTLPHPRARLRAFVLVPWRELEPDATLAGAGRVADLLATPEVAADATNLRRRGDFVLRPVADCTR